MINHLTTSTEIPRKTIEVTCDPWMFSLSFVVALVVMYITFYFAERVMEEAHSHHKKFWYRGGIFVFGAGQWVAYLIGMLALKLEIAFFYDMTKVASAFLVSMMVAAGIFHIISTPRYGYERFVPAAIFTGAGMSAISLVAKNAMVVDVEIVLVPLWSLLSIAVTLVGSTFGYWLIFSQRIVENGGVLRLWGRMGGVLVLALTLSVVHYISMKGTEFVLVGNFIAAAQPSHYALKIVMGSLFFVITLVALVGYYFDHQHIKDLETMGEIFMQEMDQHEKDTATYKNRCIKLEEQVRLQMAELQKMKRFYEENKKIKGDFAAIMWHELYTPIHTVWEISKHRKQDIAPQEAVNHMLQNFISIEKIAQELENKLQQMVSQAKKEEEEGKHKVATIDMFKIIKECLKENTSLIGKKAITISMESPQIETKAQCDLKKIKQVVVYLLNNAIRHSPYNGKIEIMFSHSKLPAGRRQTDEWIVPALAVMIQDYGEGIALEKMDLLFTAPPTLATGKEETGEKAYNMSYCKDIIEEHFGKIWAENVPGKGARFTFMLPRQKIEQIAPVKAST